MAFIDNSGDIILDAVLTDAGRKRLAAGDGSFRIAKFALGDDEIDYSLYNTGATSGQEDLRILQLPVFEAFTNNTSVLKTLWTSLEVCSRSSHHLLIANITKHEVRAKHCLGLQRSSPDLLAFRPVAVASPLCPPPTLATRQRG